MNKKILKSAGITIFILIILILSAYLGLSRYYRDGFSYGTWINGIYCTGKSVDEVNAELLKNCTYEGLTVYNKEGYFYNVKAEEIGYTFDFKEALTIYLDKQNPYLWIENIVVSREHELIPVTFYDEEKLSKIFETIPFLSEEAEDSARKVYIIKSHAGYELVNERAGVLNKEKAKDIIRQSLSKFEETIHLYDMQCYEDLPVTDEMREVLAEWERIEDFQNCHIVYEFGEEKIPIDASIVCDWIKADKEGNFLYKEDGSLAADEGEIKNFIERLADEYDSVGKARYFKSTKGDIVKVLGGTYGNKIDRKAEIKYLTEAFLNKVSEIHEPEYIQKAWKQGKNDIGQTYIEIDMGEQMMYYYKDGKKELETPVVTGNTGRRMGTKAGVNYVYGKQENRILRGPGYASHVNFWMPVKGNIGIHDAAWRDEYGGEIYKTGGSHGCINTPYDKMSELYGMVEVGTPVVMFYE